MNINILCDELEEMLNRNIQESNQEFRKQLSERTTLKELAPCELFKIEIMDNLGYSAKKYFEGLLKELEDFNFEDMIDFDNTSVSDYEVNIEAENRPDIKDSYMEYFNEVVYKIKKFIENDLLMDDLYSVFDRMLMKDPDMAVYDFANSPEI